MARSLKTKGIEELRELLKRVNRQHALGRINVQDAEWLTKQLLSVQSHIEGMAEEEDETYGTM